MCVCFFAFDLKHRFLSLKKSDLKEQGRKETHVNHTVRKSNPTRQDVNSSFFVVVVFKNYISTWM